MDGLFMINHFSLLLQKNIMGAIIIKADTKSNRILSDLARKLWGKVLNMNDEQFEDFALGSLMDSVKTGETVSREEIMKKLTGL
jgi:hypothetical protein